MASTGSVGKKPKAKKAVDPGETGKLLAARIGQLEHESALDKDEQQEVERETKKSTRDMNNILASMPPIERLDHLQKKYSELFADLKRMERENSKTKKRAELLQKEKDFSRSELNKTIGLKEKLEKLAREFTKDNKKLKDDYKRLEDTEKQSRQIMSDKDVGLLSVIEDVVTSKPDPERQKRNLEADEAFRMKFKSFVDHYNARELHFTSLMRMKEMDLQHQQGRAEYQKQLADQEIARSRQLSSQVSAFAQTEAELRTQLNVYVDKFRQVEETLNNSNELFLTFRKEMEEMSKKTKRLEKENLTLTKKHEATNRNICQMVDERAQMTEDMAAVRKKALTLEATIRYMQAQGRPLPPGTEIPGDEQRTDSEYEESEGEEEYIGSDGLEYDDDTEEDIVPHPTTNGLPTFGPIPPPSMQAHRPKPLELNGVHA